jgi:hypothetical protein
VINDGIKRWGDEHNELMIDGKIVKQVSKLKYHLGEWITDKRRCKMNIEFSLGMEKDAVNKWKELLSDGLSRAIEKGIVNDDVLVCSVS